MKKQGRPRRDGNGRYPPWTEDRIASVMAYQLMRDGRSVLVVPRCHWVGHECDLLVIEPGLRIIDVEVKISRADLKADAKKDKWWKRRPWSRRRRAEDGTTPAGEPFPRQWPDKVWKHYYVMPAEIWDESLLAGLPAASGVLLLNNACTTGFSVRRQPKANPDARPITPADAIDIARLASLRMWSALNSNQQAKEA